MVYTPNVLADRLEVQFELWLKDDRGGWHKEPLENMDYDKAVQAWERHCRVMPNCPAKLMRIQELKGN